MGIVLFNRNRNFANTMAPLKQLATILILAVYAEAKCKNTCPAGQNIIPDDGKKKVTCPCECAADASSCTADQMWMDLSSDPACSCMDCPEACPEGQARTAGSCDCACPEVLDCGEDAEMDAMTCMCPGGDDDDMGESGAVTQTVALATAAAALLLL